MPVCVPIDERDAPAWIDVAGHDAALLAVIEVGLGSMLHALHMPLTGYVLSLNQGFFLSRAVRSTRQRHIPLVISNIVATLKSLSPAGPRLTPMLAICMQGLLYSIGTVCCGANLVGMILGSLLACLWAFAQPVLMFYLLFGKTLLDVANYFYGSLNEVVRFSMTSLWIVLLGFVAVKLVLASLLAVAAYYAPETFILRYHRALLRAGQRRRAKFAIVSVPTTRNATVSARDALRDLCSPWFLLSLAFTALFFCVVDTQWTRVIWGLLRPLACGFILFFAVRMLSFEWLIQRCALVGAPRFAASLRRAIDTLNQL